MLTKHSWSHKDVILHFCKKKENISRNYTVHMNLEEQFSVNTIKSGVKKFHMIHT